MKLLDYGIQSEDSDMRAHVSVSNGTVYLFPTYSGILAIQSLPPTAMRTAYTGSIVTARGYIVPVKDIQELKTIPIPQDVFEQAGFSEGDNTSVKGDKAVLVVKEMIKRGLVPITLQPEEVTDEKMQIEGTDIVITAKCKLQVKCDWKAGKTGNVFLQIAERNIAGAH